MNEFQERHPLVIDIGHNQHLRFGDLLCAARTAVDRRKSVFDERQKRLWSYEECLQLVNARG